MAITRKSFAKDKARGDRIKAFMKLFGWTRDDLANKLQVSKGLLSDYMAGGEMFSSHSQLMANTFGISISELLEGDKGGTYSPEQIRAVKAMWAAPEDIRALLLEMAEKSSR